MDFYHSYLLGRMIEHIYCRSLQRAINCKSPLNSPFVILKWPTVPHKGKEENIHFTLYSVSANSQTERKNNFKKKKSR